jgi:CheY-like chemotaxis protein
MRSSLALHPSVLLVDDSRDGLLVRRALLEEQGYRVQIASNGEEGLELFKAGAFDIVVTDNRMPVMTGLELIRHIRAENHATPVVLLSGMVEPLGLTVENTGADAVIAKNNTEAVNLIRSVRRLLNRIPSRKPPMSQRRAVARARA